MQEKLVDERLDRNDFKAEDVKKLIEIALACTQSPASSRPTMSEVLVMLSSDRSVEQKTLSRPSFLDPERDYRTVLIPVVASSVFLFLLDISSNWLVIHYGLIGGVKFGGGGSVVLALIDPHQLVCVSPNISPAADFVLSP
ncbi:cysteine-rich receptor-like protein kinase 2 [Forsythia ovata]|uniref:Cysteine-rich receptor-like protein kinase 2 n=1 Tax=Forsythia ovata TaxID=205694 RepID=A0ABD1NW96_9LAMI